MRSQLFAMEMRRKRVCGRHTYLIYKAISRVEIRAGNENSAIRYFYQIQGTPEKVTTELCEMRSVERLGIITVARAPQPKVSKPHSAKLAVQPGESGLPACQPLRSAR